MEQKNSGVVYGNMNQIGVQNNYADKKLLPKDLSLYIPQIELNDVIGRGAKIDKLRTLLINNNPTVVVNGLGGIGKTTLAEAYLKKYYTAYKHVVWITQTNDNTIKADFIDTKGLIKNLAIDTTNKDINTIFDEILIALKAIKANPNLLVIDNATSDINTIKNFLPHSPSWHLLLTSREIITSFYTELLDFLEPDDAFALFQKHCTVITDNIAIKELLRVVGYHTLTIEILAKTAQYQRYDVSTLKKAIETDLEANIAIKHNQEQTVDNVFSYLSTVFDMSSLKPDACWLMKQLACLPATEHSYDNLISYINTPEKNNIVAKTLNDLVKKGWIQESHNNYSMHRLVAEVICKKVAIVPNDVKNLLNFIIEKLLFDKTKDNPINKFQWIGFGEALEKIFLKETIPIVASLQNNLALILQKLGDYAQAKILLEKAILSDEKNFGTEHPTTAIRYSNLAMVLKELGDYTQAKILLEKAMLSAEKNFGTEHPTTAIRYSNLAMVIKDLKEYKNALTLAKKALAIFEKTLPPTHPYIAQAKQICESIKQEMI